MRLQFIIFVVIYAIFFKAKGNNIIYNRILDYDKQFLPDDVRAFYDELNDQERVILYEIVKTHDGSDGDAVKMIYERFPSFSFKIEKLNKKLDEKINKLSNETKFFLNHIKYEAGLLIPNKDNSFNEEKINEFIKYFVQKYNKLSQQGKEELKKDFPALDVIAKKHNILDVFRMFPKKMDKLNITD
uniref:Fatty-acid and retinol-binding protein 1 n=1 Tax=Strongyloides venezuelensis TaxID=75913 RepID=A0A0K0FTN9_STRVS